MSRERLRLLAPRLLLVAVAAVAGARAPDAVRAAHADRERTEGLTRVDRELAGARSVDLAGGFLRRALVEIPPDAVFYVAVGDAAPVSNPVALDAFPPFAAYWLLPRRRTHDPGEADWVVSYGGDLDALGLRYARRLEDSPGLVLAEVER